ncbi:MAG: enoyl-CoA hydratase/isomerase family protein [Ignavibacteriaceae bacterium]|nr:enoyl-CoA hydratase/isomerase family protein [Ignavibacteriaceae bacterium]
MILSEIEGQIGLIKLNRPEKRNSLHPDLVNAFLAKFNEFNLDRNIKAIIITGEGTSFCAGADLSYLNQLKNNSVPDNDEDSQLLSKFFLSVYESDKPTIAAVNGPAIAGGCGLATACDFIFADEKNAKFGYSEVKIGFLPAIVSFLLLRRLSEFKAKQLLITGDIISAFQAQNIGLVEYISEENNTLNDAQKFAEKISKNSLYSISETKKLIRQIYSLRYDDAVKFAVNLNVIARTSDDFHEGLNKFISKG